MCRSVVLRSGKDTWLREEFQTSGESGETCSCPPQLAAMSHGSRHCGVLLVLPSDGAQTYSWPFCFPQAGIFKLLLSRVRTPTSYRHSDVPHLPGERPSLAAGLLVTPPWSTSYPALRAILYKTQTRLWPNHELLLTLRRVPNAARRSAQGPSLLPSSCPRTCSTLARGVPFPVTTSLSLLRRPAHMSHPLGRPC